VAARAQREALAAASASAVRAAAVAESCGAMEREDRKP
jgi:hypothetical protein